MQQVKGDHGHQHQQTARQRVEKELDGGVAATLMAPDADQEEERQEHRFPE